MLEKLLQVQTLSLVLIGSFNPIIIQPFWLLSKGLIREDEANTAKVPIIHDEISKIEIDWLSIEVTRNRFELKSSKTPYFDPLKDIATGIIRILKETPIYSIGINHVYDISLASQEEYYKFGNKLTPLSFWESEFNDPRLLQLEIYEKERKDKLKGSRRIKIVPSDQSISFGVAFNINDHFDFNSDNKVNISDFLDIQWENSLFQSKEIVNNLLEKIINL